MKYVNCFKRYELKYLMTVEQMNELLEIMNNYMISDKFGESSIRNIYYDTNDKLLIRRSLERPCYKEKLRVRSYGKATPDSTVFIELKKKYKGIVYKRRIEATESDAERYLDEGIALPNQNQITREIDYFLNFYNYLEPSIFISYDRQAFFSATDSNFRVTFDRNIIYRNYDLSLTDDVYGESILEDDMVLMEIKTAYGIPMWLLSFLSNNKIYKTSFSKYGNAYIKNSLPVLTGR